MTVYAVLVTETETQNMNRVILLLSLFVLSQATYAQCDKNVTFKSYAFRIFHNDKEVQSAAIDATITFDSDKYSVKISMMAGMGTLSGTIKEVTLCQWIDFMKNGKAQYKGTLRDGDEDPVEATIEIISENSVSKFILYPEPGAKLQFDIAEYFMAEGTAPQDSSHPPVEKLKDKKETKK